MMRIVILALVVVAAVGWGRPLIANGGFSHQKNEASSGDQITDQEFDEFLSQLDHEYAFLLLSAGEALHAEDALLGVRYGSKILSVLSDNCRIAAGHAAEKSSINTLLALPSLSTWNRDTVKRAIAWDKSATNDASTLMLFDECGSLTKQFIGAASETLNATFEVHLSENNFPSIWDRAVDVVADKVGELQNE